MHPAGGSEARRRGLHGGAGRRPPRLSVLLPCRDAAAYLKDAAASLVRQTFEDYEILAVDDGSSDATPRMLEAWAGHDARVQVLSSHGRGLVAALSLALRSARGELVARMDADDIALPDRFERQVGLLDARPEVSACGTRVRYFSQDRVGSGSRRYERWLNALSEPAELARDIFVECPIAHPALMARRDALLRVGGYRDAGWPEDYDLVLRLWAAGRPLANVPEVLLRWRERADRLSRSDARYSLDAFRRCKVHYLRRTLLATRAGAVVWGAGSVGKRFARELVAQGVRLRAFVELDPRKIGQTIHGAPVIARRKLGRFRDALVLAAVGSPGARADIREWLTTNGWKDGRDFVAVA